MESTPVYETSSFQQVKGTTQTAASFVTFSSVNITGVFCFVTGLAKKIEANINCFTANKLLFQASIDKVKRKLDPL